MTIREVVDRSIEVEGDLYFLQLRWLKDGGEVHVSAIAKHVEDGGAIRSSGLGSFPVVDLKEALDSPTR